MSPIGDDGTETRKHADMFLGDATMTPLSVFFPGFLVTLPKEK